MKRTSQKSHQALMVPKWEAKRTLQKVSEVGLLDRDRKVLAKGEFVEVPVTDALSGYETIIQKDPLFYRREPDLSLLLKDVLDSEKRDLLPRGWSILGRVIVVKIDSRLDEFESKIGEALLSMYPRCSCVLRDWGVEGRFREPKREVIARGGSENIENNEKAENAGCTAETVETVETIVKENGVQFKLDAMKVMYSVGNLKEKMRMSRLGDGEFVVDMFAGIGYFSIPMAVHSKPCRIISIELNPTAYRYLEENVRLNRVEDVVEPRFGDCAKVAPVGVADRVIMGYVGTTDMYLEPGIRALRPGGALHYHQTVPEWQYPLALETEVKEAARNLGRRVRVLRRAKVKKYSPGMVHAVLDAEIG